MIRRLLLTGAIAAAVPFGLFAATSAGASGPTGHPDPTAAQMAYAVAHPTSAAQLRLNPPPPDTWTCTAATWMFDTAAGTTGLWVTTHTGGILGADQITPPEEYKLCGWVSNSVNQFALYDIGTGKYVGVDETGNDPLVAYLAGGDSRDFFHLDAVIRGGGCYIQFYGATSGTQYAYTGTSPGYELLGGSSASAVFQFQKFPSTSDFC